MPTIRLDDNAVTILLNYRFPGNIRQLKNISRTNFCIEEERSVSAQKLHNTYQ